MPISVEDPTLTIPEVAEYLSCSPDHVRRMISRGELRAVRYGRLIRVRPEDLQRAGKPVTRVGGAA